MRRWLAGMLLRPFLTRHEALDVVADLEELAQDRGAVGSWIYFWAHLAGYPVRVVMDGTKDWWREIVGGTTGGGGMEGMGKDLRYAIRSLRRSPGFSSVVTLIIAVNLGATAAIYSVVKGVLLDPLPVEEPDRLVALWMGGAIGERTRMTPGNLKDAEGLDVFASVAGFRSETASLSRGEDAIFLRGGGVTPGYFATLGVQPALGRSFRVEDGVQGAPPVTVLSHRVWQQAFGADPSTVGSFVDLSGVSTEVVGVAPPGIFPTSASVGGEIPFTAANQDYFVPLRFSSELWNQRRSHVLGAIARVAPGVDPASAESALATLSARLQASEPMNEGEFIVMSPFTEEVVGDLRFPLLTLLGAVGLVLLIGVVNVGALFVLRADDRRGEIGIRTALGAPWSRVVRLHILESGMLTVVATVGALVIAFWSIDLMRLLVPYQIPRLAEVRLDGTGLAVSVAMGTGLAIVLGLWPLSRLNGGSLHGSERQGTAGLGRRRRQGVAVAFQSALGIVVLVGAALLTRSFAALQAVDPGFDREETWVMPLVGSGGFGDELVDEVRSLPGVATAARTYDHPLQRSWVDGFRIRGIEPPDGGLSATLRPFGEGYFETVGVGVTEGRIPDRLDLANGARLAVVNEAFREAHFPDGRAVGAVIEIGTAARMFGEDQMGYEIIGVVEDVRFLGPDRPSEPAYYLPLSAFAVGGNQLLVRPESADLDVVEGVRRLVREGYPGMAVQSAEPLSAIMDDRLARPRFNMMLLVSFAGMALLLCGLGVYGLMGRAVASRLREIGIRMALGADNRSVAGSVLKSALRPMAVGVAVGVVAAFGLVGVLRSLLYEISPGDPVSFVASSLFMAVVALLAAAVPTFRAVSIDPASTLRDE